MNSTGSDEERTYKRYYFVDRLFVFLCGPLPFGALTFAQGPEQVKRVEGRDERPTSETPPRNSALKYLSPLFKEEWSGSFG